MMFWTEDMREIIHFKMKEKTCWICTEQYNLTYLFLWWFELVGVNHTIYCNLKRKNPFLFGCFPIILVPEHGLFPCQLSENLNERA